MRSGDEPGHARSALRLRFVLAGFGLVAALVAALVVYSVVPGAIVVVFLVIALVAAVDLIVVGREIRQGPHFQPGSDVPPYRPVDPQPRTRRPLGLLAGRPLAERPLTERIRMRRYLTLMIVCLILIVLAWFWVRFYSTAIAVAMSMVAAVLPPIAVIVANFGVRLPTEPPPEGRSSPWQGGSTDADHPDPPG